MIKQFLIRVFLFLLTVASLKAQQPFSHSSESSLHLHSHPDIKLINTTSRGYDITYYHFDLAVSDTTSFISGSVTVQFIRDEAFPDTLWLDFSDNMLIDSILYIDNSPVEFLHSGDKLKIPMPETSPGVINSVEIFYQGTPRDNGNSRDGVFNAVDGGTGTRVTYTLSEPFSAKNWFPCKQDLRDKADSVTLEFTVEKDLRVGSNGLLIKEESVNDSHIRYVWKSRYPIAYYLISFAVAEYDDYSFFSQPLADGDSLLIQNYIYKTPGYLSANKEKLDITADLISYFSNIFSLYPFADEKYGHATAPFGGGMEHQTMSTMLYYEFFLVAHELAHQWFGDNVTCATWQDIWINEGFASYAEYLGFQYLIGQAQADNWMATAHTRALREPNGSVYVPFEDIENENRIFDYNLSYKKGASILHMLRYEIGNDTLFYDVLRAFQTEYKDLVATGDDFIQVLNRITENDFTWFFDQWYYGRGYPIFEINWIQEGDSVYIYSNQQGSYNVTDFFRTKLEFRLNYSDASETVAFYQDSPNEIFTIYVPEKVMSMNFDPKNWLLKQVSQNSNLDTQLLPENYFDVFPNPTEEIATVRINRPGDHSATIQIVALNGSILLEERLTSSKTTLRLGALPDGLYLLRLQPDRGGIHIKRMIKITPE